MASWINSSSAMVSACSFAVLSVIISALHIIQHLMHFSAPHIQHNVVRIILICPVYAISSVIALSLGQDGQYAEIFRDLYEAFVVYCFLYLMLEYCGGETDCVYMMENEPPLKLPFPFCCVSKARNARLMRLCNKGVLQFVIVKPVVAVIDIFMIAYSYSDDKTWKIMETVLYNISYSIALYFLMVFYLATKKQLKKYKPVYKFLSVKAIIFATYYQSLLVSLSAHRGHHGLTRQEALRWNDWILCLEMIFFAMCLFFAFPAKEFVAGAPDRKRVLKNLRHALQMKDLYQNVVHNFNPVYRDYALQSSQKFESENRDADVLPEESPMDGDESSHQKQTPKKKLFANLRFGSSPFIARLRRPSSRNNILETSSNIISNANTVEECHHQQDNTDASANASPQQLTCCTDEEDPRETSLEIEFSDFLSAVHEISHSQHDV